MDNSPTRESSDSHVAIIGMAGRFPGARDLDQFWRNLRDGVESIRFFSPAELAAAGLDEATIANPRAVPGHGVLDDVDQFDAAFFDYLPGEAALIDPQQRLFLECAWEALEQAGYIAAPDEQRIGVYAGIGANTYLLATRPVHPATIKSVDDSQLLISNDKDFLTTRVSYKLNLTGPSMVVQTACSTSLVAIHMACQSLLNGECVIALAGGVSLTLPQHTAYIYQEGGIFSPDGHCRPFDALGQGTNMGDGVGIVVLKLLQDALQDGDTIHAVIRGSAINNDGAAKPGYTAPSVEGQARAIEEAQALAEVTPDSIGYIEAHGTATPLGDPIEIAALTQVFRAQTARAQFCAIGSVKSNIGHTNTAAGVAGLIKTVLALKHGQIPPSLNFTQPNPKIDFATSPFFVNGRLRPWPPGPAPRRAGVSSFGIGGTNAHVILEEAPSPEPAEARRAEQLLVLSAKTPAALGAAAARLAAHLETHDDQTLADVACTLQRGRRAFQERLALVCHSRADAVAALARHDATRMHMGSAPQQRPPVAFLFPGQGAQYIAMGAGLYQQEPIFREWIDRCAETLKPHLGLDIRQVIYDQGSGVRDQGLGNGSDTDQSAQPLTPDPRSLEQTQYTQPALFAVEYALAQLWMSWGVRPLGMLGHSIGEYVAGALAGVFTLEDALALVALRGRLMQSLPPGAMVSVALPASELRPLLDADLSLAALNGRSCVVAGPAAAMEALTQRLAADGVVHRPLATSHAFHSAMMQPIVEPFLARLRHVALRPPALPFISNVSGAWIGAEQATDPVYWSRQLREPVRFADGLDTLLSASGGPATVLLEVGPGHTLSALARQHASGAAQAIVASLPGPRQAQGDRAALLESAAQLWVAGVELDWEAMSGDEARRRVPLPTYPFERSRHWIDNFAPWGRPSAVHVSVGAEGVSGTAAPAAPALGAVPSRHERILAQLLKITGDISGIDPGAIRPDANFFEVGFDSLLLLRLAQAIRDSFGAEIAVADLFESAATLSSLATHLDGLLPPDALPLGEPRGPSVALTMQPHAPAHPAVVEIVREQIQLMARQLDLLERAGGDPAGSAALRQAATTLEAGARHPGAPGGAPAAPPPFVAYQPNSPGAGAALTPRQQQHLDALIERYTRRTRESKRRTQAQRLALADNRSSTRFRLLTKELLYPLIAERSAGARIWDVDGNEYIDLAMGFGAILFGHSPDFVRQALDEQLDKGWHVGPQSDLAGEVAELIRALTGVERVTFTNSGTESVMLAVRLARAVTRRAKIAVFTGSYHGTFDGVLARLLRLNGATQIAPLAPGVAPSMVSDILMLDYGTPESLRLLRSHAHELAAVLVEPVQSRRPDFQPAAFLRELRELTSAAGAALIFDEVITGFRPHPGGAQALFGIQADIVTYGKVIGGGMPIGVTAGRATFMDAVDGGMWRYGDDSYPQREQTFFGGTFCKHPLAMAAARAVLRRMQSEGPALQERLNRRTEQLAATLNSYFEQEQVPIKMVRFGSLFRFVFPDALPYMDLLLYFLIERGVYIWEGATCFLSTAHDDDDLARIVAAFQSSIAAMRAGGFLPDRPGTPGGPPTPDQPEAEAAPTPLTLPLTIAQQQLWAAVHLDQEAGRAYHESVALRLRGPLDHTALRQALQTVIDRHEALRTTFSAGGDFQTIAPALRLELPTQDLAALPVAERERQARAFVDRMLDQPFDLERGPLLRAQIVRLDEREHLLVLVLHHLIVDGWSLATLQQEVAACYAAACQSRPCDLAAPMPYRDYLRQQIERERGAAFQRSEAYWIGQFESDIPLLRLPLDFARPAYKTYRGAVATHRLDQALAEGLRSFSARQHCTLYITLYGAFRALLHHLTEQPDLIVGMHAAGQWAAGERPLVGYCINVLPIRAGLDGDPRFSEYLALVRRQAVQAYAHQDYPFGLLATKLNLRGRDRAPLVSVAFNLDRTAAARLHGLEVEELATESAAVAWDLSLNVVETEQEFKVDWRYNTDLLTAATIQSWIACYETLLAAIATPDDLRWSELRALLAATERRQRQGHADTLKAARLSKLNALKPRPPSSTGKQEQP